MRLDALHESNANVETSKTQRHPRRSTPYLVSAGEASRVHARKGPPGGHKGAVHARGPGQREGEQTRSSVFRRLWMWLLLLLCGIAGEDWHRLCGRRRLWVFFFFLGGGGGGGGGWVFARNQAVASQAGSTVSPDSVSTKT